MRLNSAAQLLSQIQRGLAPVYLVAGEEPLLIQEALDAIRGGARRAGFEERTVLTVESGFRWQQLVQEVCSPSLFATRRVLEVQMPKGPNGHRRGKGADDDDDAESEAGDKADDGPKALVQLAARPAPDVLLLLVAGKLDKRGRESAWYNALDAAGASLYLWPVKPEELPGWIDARLRAAGLRIDAEALRLLAERTEGNLLAAQQEVDKLALLHPGATLGLEQVEAAVADSAHYDLFGWFNKVMAGDAHGAVRGLDGLRGEGMEVPQVLWVVADGLRKLARAAQAYAARRDAASAMDAAGVFKMNQPAYARALERSRSGQVLGWLRDCAQIDALAKSSGTQSAAWEELLTLVLAASGAAKPKPAALRQ
jgi:DNA polymerase-3 subunit delta